MPANNEQVHFDSTNFVVFLYKWRKPLMFIGLMAAVTSSVIALFIPDKFKSTVIMFPTQTSSISKSLLSDNAGAKHDILQFGDEEESEQLLQVLYSDEIRNRIAGKYKLMEHYRIDSTEKYKNTLLQEEYENNITYKRTEFMSVQIDVLDEVPQMAANIANDIASLLDSVKTHMMRARAVLGLKLVEDDYNNEKAHIKELEDSLVKLRQLGVYDYESQAEVTSEQYAIAIVKGEKEGAKLLEAKLKILADYGGAYISIRDYLEHEKKQLSALKAKYDEAKIDVTQNLPHKFILNNAYPSEKKTYPIRWLIVVVSTLAALLIALLAIVVLEKNKFLKKIM